MLDIVSCFEEYVAFTVRHAFKSRDEICELMEATSYVLPTFLFRSNVVDSFFVFAEWWCGW
jgi:hypothetical protein